MNLTKELESKRSDCAFIRYTKNSVAYRFLVIRSKSNSLKPNTIMDVKDAEFFEDTFSIKSRTSINLENGDKENETIETKFVNEHEIQWSKRPRKTTHLEDDYSIYLVDNDPKN